MKLLAIDTATEACSVALHCDGQVLLRHAVAGRSHTQRLMPMLQEVMAEAGIGYAQLDGYVCGVGPGSFAGVRIGVSFVKGLALAQVRPVVGVSSLAMLAAPLLAGGATRVLAAIDARMDEVYFAAYTADASGLPQLDGDEQVCAPAAAPAQIGRCHAVGSGWLAYEASLRSACAAELVTVDGAALPSAEQALRIAAPVFAAGQAQSAAQLLPRYLRNKVALTLQEQRARR